MASEKVEKWSTAPGHHDPEVVAKAEAVFAEMGMTPEEAIGVFYKQTALHGKFPITELIPNEETQATIRDARAGIGLVRYSSPDEMRAELDGIMAEVEDAGAYQDGRLSARPQTSSEAG